MNLISIETMKCCGVSEIHGVFDNSGKESFLGICEELYLDNVRPSAIPAFLVFTDALPSEGGKNLCSFIKKNKLGKVISLPTRRSKSTENKIKVWLWAPNDKNVIALAKKLYVCMDEKDSSIW